MVYAQSPLKGSVSDEKGLPLPGVSVKINNTATGVMTDIDGNFQLTVTPNVTIEFTYVGYLKQEMVYTGQASLNVKLQPESQLMDEVIVVGYTTKSKSQIVHDSNRCFWKRLYNNNQ